MPDDSSQAASDAILNALAGPWKVMGDAGMVVQQSLADLIAADKYLAAKAAASSPRRGIRFTRLTPDGTVNDGRCR